MNERECEIDFNGKYLMKNAENSVSELLDFNIFLGRGGGGGEGGHASKTPGGFCLYFASSMTTSGYSPTCFQILMIH